MSVGNGSPTNDFEGMIRDMSNEVTAKTFDFNSREAQKERDWSEKMSNTSHQREVNDLIRAGLNPVLSANSGAQAYSGASASGQADNSAIGMMASIYQTKMNNDNALKIAKMQNANNLEMAKISAAASNYAANQSSSASRYGTDRSKYGLIDNWLSGFLGNGNDSSASRIGSFFGRNFSEANSHPLYEYGWGRGIGTRIGKSIRRFFRK